MIGTDAGERRTTCTVNRRLALGVLCLAPFVSVLDTVIVAIALPAMERDLGFSSAGVQWVLNGYALALGGLLLLGGRLADVLGRRRVFVAGMGIFALASFAGGAATSPEMLVAARVLLGVGAAAFEPAALALVTTLFPDPSRRNRAIGAYGAMVGLGYLAGILLGGVLTELAGWRWVLFVNVPAALCALALAPMVLPERRDPATRDGFDLRGATTVTLGVGALIYALTLAPSRGWGAGSTLGFVVLGGALLAGFAVVERRADAPLLPLEVIRIRGVAIADAAALLKGCVGIAQLYILTLYFQSVLGRGPLQASMLFVPMALVSIPAGMVAGRLATRLGIKPTAGLGSVLLAGGLLVAARLSAEGNLAIVLSGAVVAEVGFMILSVPLTIAASTGVPESRRGLAAGLLGAVTQLGNALGLGVVAAVVAARTGSPHGEMVDPEALVTGLRTGLLVCVAFVVLALLLVSVALPRSQAAPRSPLAHVASPGHVGLGGPGGGRDGLDRARRARG